MELRNFQYGHGNAIMILVADLLGLSPALVEEAKRLLDGGEIHPMTGAAMEREAIRINGLVRENPAQINEANAHAERLKVQYGFLAASS
jgi:hypothetical protein